MHKQWRAYLIAIAVTALVALLRFALDETLQDDAPLILFVIAVTAAAWYGGLVPGLVAAALSTAVGSYLFLKPAYSFWIENPADQIRIVSFIAIGALISWLFDKLHTATRKADERRQALQVTLSSIGDAVITTDIEGRVTSLNPVAEELTGWSHAEAQGMPLTTVFRIVNEETREIAANPVNKVLESGKIAGLANHTVLIAHDGTEHPIDDSASPIRDAEGAVIGVVLIFRDVAERRRAEKNLKESEARKAAVLTTALDAIVTMNAEGAIVDFNPAAERIFGYSRDHAIGRELAELIIPENLREQHRRGMAHYLVTGEAPVLNRRIELTALKSDGKEFPVELAITRISSEGAPLFTGHIRDISERKAAEQQLKRWEHIFTHAGWAVAVAEPENNTLVSVNPAFAAMHGYSVDELIGRPLVDVFAPESRDELARHALIAHEKGDHIYEAKHRRGDGGTFDVVTHVTAFRDGESRVLFRAATFQDVSEQKRAAEALRNASEILEARVADRTAELARTNEFLRALLEDLREGIVACDADGVLTLFNRATREFHNLPFETLPAKDWAQHYDLFHADGITKMRTPEVPLFRALSGEHVRDAEMVIAPKAGARRTLLASGSAFYDSEGTKLGAVVSMHDVTARRAADEALARASEQLEIRVVERTRELAHANEALEREIGERRRVEAALMEADRRKDEFLATLAHELRNPLAPLRNAIEIIKRSDDDGQIAQKMRPLMERQLAQMVRLIDDLLDVSRIARGKFELRKERITLGDAVKSAIETCTPLVSEAGHTLKVTLPQVPVYVDADPVRLAQALCNLVNNAVKYTERGGSIDIAAQRRADEAIISVRDNGIGIAPEVLPRVFDMFAQGHTSADREGGLGIGLSIARQLIEMHGGTITAESGGAGRGSEFVISLPVAKDEGGTKDEAVWMKDEAEAPVAAVCRVLVVDDNEDAAQSLALMLDLLGHEVRVAHDGETALELAEGFIPEVVVLDLGMPRMNGFDVARSIRGTPWGRASLLIALTGWGQDDDKRRTQAAGFDHHLTKPVDFSTLEKLLVKPVSPARGKAA